MKTETKLKSMSLGFPLNDLDKGNWPWVVKNPQKTLSKDSLWLRISIVTPSYNQGQFIEETIRSVLLQGYPNLEYIIIDGGSTDGTVDILKKYAPWITYWVSEKDNGQSHAINKGWDMATGDIIAYLNSDDIYPPGVFEKVAKAFSEYPTASAVVGRVNFINTQSQLISTSKKPYLPVDGPCDLTLFDPDLWFLPQPSSFWRRGALEQAGMYVRGDLHYTMDRELFYRTCKIEKVVLLDDVLAAFRNHGQNKSIAEMLKMYREDARAINYMDDGNFMHRLIRLRTTLSWRARGYYFYATQIKDRKKAWLYLLLAVLLKFSYLKKLLGR